MPDTEGPENGEAKYSMDRMTMDGQICATRALGSLVMVNHGDGGNFSHAETGNGTRGDRHWPATRAANDIGNVAQGMPEYKSNAHKSPQSWSCIERPEWPA